MSGSKTFVTFGGRGEWWGPRYTGTLVPTIPHASFRFRSCRTTLTQTYSVRYGSPSLKRTLSTEDAPLDRTKFLGSNWSEYIIHMILPIDEDTSLIHMYKDRIVWQNIKGRPYLRGGTIRGGGDYTCTHKGGNCTISSIKNMHVGRCTFASSLQLIHYPKYSNSPECFL